jgi:hypothetical protein
MEIFLLHTTTALPRSRAESRRLAGCRSRLPVILSVTRLAGESCTRRRTATTTNNKNHPNKEFKFDSSLPAVHRRVGFPRSSFPKFPNSGGPFSMLSSTHTDFQQSLYPKYLAASNPFDVTLVKGDAAIRDARGARQPCAPLPRYMKGTRTMFGMEP